MNTPSPLIPQGSLHGQKGRSNVQLAVITIVAIHVVFFGGLLLQGCKRDTKTGDGSATNETNTLEPLTYGPGPGDTNAGMYYTPGTLPGDASTSATATATAPATPDYTLPTTPTNVGFESTAPGFGAGSTTAAAQPPVEMKQYTVVKGDTLSKIAKNSGVTISALTRANPNVDPSRLQIGMKLSVPAAEVRQTTGAATGSSTSGSAGESTTYVVKAGDTLTRIAKNHGTTVSALRSANGLKVSRLMPGQKIKIPASARANAAEASLRTAPQAAGTVTNQ